MTNESLARLVHYVGTTRTLNMTIADENGDPLDLGGRTVRWAMSVRRANGDVSTTALVEKEAEVVSAAEGTCRVVLLRADTEELEPGGYYQEWEVVESGGESWIAAVGQVTLRANVGS